MTDPQQDRSGLSTPVRALLDKGVRLPVPASVEIADDVDLDRISGDGVVIHAGSRIRGRRTVISAGCAIGREGPVTIENCQLGPRVALSGGYASGAVFLEGSSMGLGHHVRAGCLLEEEASGAHTVGLKQTILFPWVTLGSLINFCDAFMSGGTSRSDHSEVGSSYIHFNFTPSGDKTTPSMFGDVARGVMLRQRPIFLGGQGGTVGPVRVPYGTVIGAGSILRSDVVQPNSLVLVGPPPSMHRPFEPDDYGRIGRIVAKNLLYLADLDALEQWYRHVRQPFFARQELGEYVYEGALVVIAEGRAERIARLGKLVAKLPGVDEEQRMFTSEMAGACGIFGTVSNRPDDDFIRRMRERAQSGTAYLDAIRSLTPEEMAAGTSWLQDVVDGQWARVAWRLTTLTKPMAI